MVSLYSLYSFQIFNYHDSLGGRSCVRHTPTCSSHSQILANIQNHNYGIMSLFIKTHWMAGRHACMQAGRQAGRQASKQKQASTGAGKQKESKTRQVRSHPGYTTLTIISVNDGGST
jgi:hypothetical protein